MMSNLTNRDYIEYREILSAMYIVNKINQYCPSLVLKGLFLRWKMVGSWKALPCRIALHSTVTPTLLAIDFFRALG